MALIVARAAGAETVSWPHGFMLEEPSRFTFLADQVVLHGPIEEDFARSQGIDVGRIAVAGRSKRTVKASRKNESRSVAIISSFYPDWTADPSDSFRSTVLRVLQLLNTDVWSPVLKLHPCVDYGVQWLDAEAFQGVEVVQKPWTCVEFQQLAGAIFVGHPGSSLIDIAALGSVPAVVVPLSEADREFFGKFGFAYDKPEQAVAALEMAVPEGPHRLRLLGELSGFLRHCLGDQPDPEGVLTNVLHHASPQ